MKLLTIIQSCVTLKLHDFYNQDHKYLRYFLSTGQSHTNRQKKRFPPEFMTSLSNKSKKGGVNRKTKLFYRN